MDRRILNESKLKNLQISNYDTVIIRIGYKGYLGFRKFHPLYTISLITEDICIDIHYWDHTGVSFLYPTVLYITVPYIRGLSRHTNTHELKANPTENVRMS